MYHTEPQKHRVNKKLEISVTPCLGVIKKDFKNGNRIN